MHIDIDRSVYRYADSYVHIDRFTMLANCVRQLGGAAEAGGDSRASQVFAYIGFTRYIYIYMYIFIYIYIFICIYLYIYIYMYI